MLREEKRLVYGLYHATGGVGREMPFRAGEIAWFTKARIPKGKQCRDADGKFRTHSVAGRDWLATLSRTRFAAEQPLAYLNERGLVRVTADGDIFRVSVTATGADLARDLDSVPGRIQLWYAENRTKFWWAAFFSGLSLAAWLIKAFAL